MWAHSVNVCGHRHRLADHLRSTAVLARRFAEPFGAGELAAALGLLHDAGKAAQAWQSRLVEVEESGLRVGVPHKELGARLAWPVAGPVSMAILGHHGGLGELAGYRQVAGDQIDVEACDRLVLEIPESRALIAGSGPLLLPEVWRRDPLVLEMGLRLIFSALVDADHLDTAAHFAGLGGWCRTAVGG